MSGNTICNNFRWNKGETYDDNGVIRNYFDCLKTGIDEEGMDYIIIPAGVNFYHGSGALANAMAEFPVEREYYTSVDFADQTNLISTRALSPNRIDNDLFREKTRRKLLNTQSSVKEVLRDTYYKVTPSWYADFETAKGYSFSNPNAPQYNCDNCVFSYKTIKQFKMLRIDTDINIYSFYYKAKLQGDDDVANAILIMFGYENLEATFVQHARNGKLHNLKRYSEYDNDRIFADWFCKNYPQYSGYAANYFDNFHSEFTFCQSLKYLERDLSDPKDWQYIDDSNFTPENKMLIDQMKKYITYNTNTHAGNLFEHSCWSTLFTEYLLDKYSNLIPPKYSFILDYSKLISAGSFLHDIGKMNLEKNTIINKTRGEALYFSVPEHPKYGKEYILGTKKIPKLDANGKKIGYIDIKDVFKAVGIRYKDFSKCFFSIICEMHWSLGVEIYDKIDDNLNIVKGNETLKNLLINYIYKILKSIENNCISGYNNNVFMFIIFSVFLISTSDVLSFQPFKLGKILQPSRYIRVFTAKYNKSKHLKFVYDIPKIYRGTNLAEKSNLTEKFKKLLPYVFVISERILQDYKFDKMEI